MVILRIACQGYEKRLNQVADRLSIDEGQSFFDEFSGKPALGHEPVTRGAHVVNVLEPHYPTPDSCSEPPPDIALYSLLDFFVLSACACSPDVTVTSSSPLPSVSRRSIFNKIHPSLSLDEDGTPRGGKQSGKAIVLYSIRTICGNPLHWLTMLRTRIFT